MRRLKDHRNLVESVLSSNVDPDLVEPVFQAILRHIALIPSPFRALFIFFLHVILYFPRPFGSLSRDQQAARLARFEKFPGTGEVIAFHRKIAAARWMECRMEQKRK